jgi:hypothetical protein
MKSGMDIDGKQNKGPKEVKKKKKKPVYVTDLLIKGSVYCK